MPEAPARTPPHRTRISPNYPDHLSYMPCSLPRWTEQVLVGFFPCPHGLPRSTGGSASTSKLSRPAQASLALRPARLQPAQGGLLFRGSDPVGFPAKPLGSYHAYRQLHGWVLLPLAICAFGAHSLHTFV